MYGSPPRGWGKLKGGMKNSRLLRFTPTRVGKTRASQQNVTDLTVHPHAGGENYSFVDTQISHTGSPPRGWGKRSRSAVRRPSVRFTPTRVGKTRWPGCRASPSAVHPHAGGENCAAQHAPLLIRGSPPRVWGKPLVAAAVSASVRFTPTRVGKTGDAYDLFVHLAVHPHACGENRRSRVVILHASGSPPRVWGKLLFAHIAHPSTPVHPHACGENSFSRISLTPLLRFTPTRVGKTPLGLCQNTARAVHPHACGENSVGALSKHSASGSPPRVWGKHRRRTILIRCCTVHPHACGENNAASFSLRSCIGSPPRVWGKPAASPRVIARMRFTPTRVGKTLLLQ